MSAQVKVTLKGEADRRKELVFSTSTTCTVGRAEDCDIQLPSDFLHMDVSRHHCLLGIDPPHVWVRDLGSKNGTYLNGVRIGRLAEQTTPRPSDPALKPECPVRGGDDIRIGHTVLHVDIFGTLDG